MVYDIIVIGSGPAGAHAALPLVEAGKSVLMIDGGKEGKPILNSAPPLSYEEMRRKREDQWKWFLGEDLSGIPLGGLEGGLGGGMTSGNRKYVLEDVERLLPLERRNAQVLQSLALGGLGAVWGATSAYLSREQCTFMGLTGIDMKPYYDDITRIIGVSGPSERTGMQPPLPVDHHMRKMKERYERKKKWFEEQKVELREPDSAVLTKQLENRMPNPLRDMDYFTDPEQSVYRPQYTIEKMKMYPNFTYLGGQVVHAIREGNGIATVESVRMNGEVAASHTSKKVIVAAGAVNSARILLQSKGMEGVTIPFVGKPHAFIAALHTAMLGKIGDQQRFSLCQGLVIDNKGENGIEAAVAQLYSYRCLGLFRLLSSLPLPARSAMDVARLLSPALVIADVRFPAEAGNNSLILKGNTVHISMEVGREEKRTRDAALLSMRQALKKLGLLPIRTLYLPEGSSSHYAGTVPMEMTPKSPLSSDLNGYLHGSSTILVADASVFARLPSLPHTLTIMANARRVALGLLQEG